MSKAIFIYQNDRTNILRACAKSQLKAAWKHRSLNGSGIKATKTAESKILILIRQGIDFSAHV